MSKGQGISRAERRRRQAQRSRAMKIAAGTGAGVGAAIAIAAPASAQEFAVTNLNDSGTGSLRAAIEDANTAPNPDQIRFQSTLSGTIELESTLDVTDTVEIFGPGNDPAAVTLDGNDGFGIMYTTAATTLWSLTFADGSSPYGGAVDAPDANLFVHNSTFTGNHASVGGAIYSGDGAAANVYESTFTGNGASTGGAIGARSSVSVHDSTFSGNRAQQLGGAIITYAGAGNASMGILTSTFNRNSAGLFGGTLATIVDQYATSTLGMDSSTISGNQAGFAGGGVAGGFTTAEINNSVIEDNFAYYGSDLYSGDFSNPPTDVPNTDDCGCYVTTFDTSFSFVGDAKGADINTTVAGSNILNGGDALLGKLAVNGGPTQTMAIGPDSPLVNKGKSAMIPDQRGEERPVQYPGIPNSTAVGADGGDIGAFELQYVTPPPPVVDRPFRILNGTPDRRTGANSIGVDIPAAGTVRILGYNTFRSTSTHFDAKGIYRVKAVPKGKFKKRLAKKGKARHIVRFMYTPDEGRRLAKGKVFAFFKGAKSGKAKAAAVNRIRKLDGRPGR